MWISGENAARKQTASLPHRVGGLILPHFTFLPFRQEGVGAGGGYRLALGKAGENLGHAALLATRPRA